MIRVVYRWEVQEASQESFAEQWRQLTLRIRTEFDGSCGSTLLAGDGNTLIGIARWSSQADLLAFRQTAGSLHLPGAELIDQEVFTEIENLTIEA